MGRKPKAPAAKPVAPQQPQGQTRKRTPQSAFDPAAGKNLYEPEEIVAVRTAKGVTQWQVKWVGYNSSANTWEPIEHLASCEDLIAAFEKRKRDQDEVAQRKEDELKAKKKAEEVARRQQAVRESGNTQGAGVAEPADEVVDGVEARAHQDIKDFKKSKRTSEVWSCFTENGANKAKHAVCRLPHKELPDEKCGEEISFAFGTTGLWNHVMWNHPDDFIKLSKEKPTKRDASGNSGMANGVPTQLPRMPTALKEELHRAHARWLTKKRRPLAIVEDEQYRDIWAKATHGTYKPPDCTTLRSFILDLSREGQERVQQVNAALREDGRKPSIAGDIWSTKNHTLSLLGITQYHINANWEIEELLVAAQPFSRESHTGDAIEEKTKACLEAMNYPADIYSGVFKKTSDNGSNMLKGWKGFDGGECVDHTAQLSLGTFIDHAHIKPTVTKLKGMTAHFHTSTGVDGLGGLTACQKECHLPKRHPVQGCVTRWSSWGEMLEFYRLEQRAVQLYDVRHSRKAGNAYRQHQMDLDNWQVNEQATAVVQVINDWVQLMEGTKSYPTMPMVLPTMYHLLDQLKPDAPLICEFAGESTYQLQPSEMHAGVLEARTEMYNDLVSRFITNLDLNAKRQYAIATLLHPCFKEYLFPRASDAEKVWALQETRTEWRRYWKHFKARAKRVRGENGEESGAVDEPDVVLADVALEPAAEAAPAVAPAAVAKKTPQTGQNVLENDDDEAEAPPVLKKRRIVTLSGLMGGALRPEGPSAVPALETKDQLEEYFREPPLTNLDVNVLKYWKAKEFEWPELARMVKQYFAAPASSAGVERVFSAAGSMHSDMRKAMNEGTLKHALFAGQNVD